MMSKVGFVLFIIMMLLAGFLMVWRYLDLRQDQAEMGRLLALQPADAAVFSAEMIADQPDPVRQYFEFMIADGAPLLTVALIEMTGRLSLGTQDAPHYMDMRATQVVAPLEGFLWKAAARSGHTWFTGSDSASWSRFWGWGVLPVVRAGGDDDHARSALGRYVAEAAFWVPAALLPGDDVTWSAPQDDLIRAIVRKGSWEQILDIRLSNDGRPLEVNVMRWSNANDDGVFRIQPFGGTLSEFRTVQGFQVPMHVEAGNFFGTDAYFPFFIAEVTDISFPPPLVND